MHAGAYQLPLHGPLPCMPRLSLQISTGGALHTCALNYHLCVSS